LAAQQLGSSATAYNKDFVFAQLPSPLNFSTSAREARLVAKGEAYFEKKGEIS